MPQEAIVISAGQHRPKDIQRGIGRTYPTGVTGISVECGVGLSIEVSATIALRKLC